MKRPAHPPAADLQLDLALQLLRQSGQDAPQGEPGSAAWMQSLIDSLVELSSRDALTGLATRRAFEVALAREIDRVARSGEPALLLALDIDHFKRIKAAHGHAVGDQVLKEVAATLAATVRPMDLVARVAGEEFAIILPSFAQIANEATTRKWRRFGARGRFKPILRRHSHVTGVLRERGA